MSFSLIMYDQEGSERKEVGDPEGQNTDLEGIQNNLKKLYDSLSTTQKRLALALLTLSLGAMSIAGIDFIRNNQEPDDPRDIPANPNLDQGEGSSLIDRDDSSSFDVSEIDEDFIGEVLPNLFGLVTFGNNTDGYIALNYTSGIGDSQLMQRLIVGPGQSRVLNLDYTPLVSVEEVIYPEIEFPNGMVEVTAERDNLPSLTAQDLLDQMLNDGVTLDIVVMGGRTPNSARYSLSKKGFDPEPVHEITDEFPPPWFRDYATRTKEFERVPLSVLISFLDADGQEILFGVFPGDVFLLGGDISEAEYTLDIFLRDRLIYYWEAPEFK